MLHVHDRTISFFGSPSPLQHPPLSSPGRRFRCYVPVYLCLAPSFTTCGLFEQLAAARNKILIVHLSLFLRNLCRSNKRLLNEQITVSFFFFCFFVFFLRVTKDTPHPAFLCGRLSKCLKINNLF